MNFFETATMDEVHPEIKELVGKWENFVETKFVLDGGQKTSMFIHGTYGSGKTYTANAIFNHFKKLWPANRIAIHNYTKMMMNATFRRVDEDDLDSVNVNDISNMKGLLIIDDLGAKVPSTKDEDILYIILNERYQSGYPTLITSNLPLEKIEEVYGSRIVARIMRMCVIIKMG